MGEERIILGRSVEGDKVMVERVIKNQALCEIVIMFIDFLEDHQPSIYCDDGVGQELSSNSEQLKSEER